jgi:hypothetical protein
MKNAYSVVAALLLCGSVSAQSYQWGKTEGKYAYDYGYGIMTDNNGDVYVAGKFEEAGANFSGTTINSQGNHDAFLAKYGADGTLKWIRTAGGANGDYAQSMYTDKTSFVYIGGEIEGYGTNIVFSNSSVSMNAVGDNDGFFAKYDLEGNLIWAKNFGSLNSEKVLAITADGSQNVYIAGYFTNTTTINGSNITGFGGRDIYLAKFDKDGNFQWFKYAGSSQRDEVKSLRCDASGNVYICGWMSKGCDFGGGVVMDTYNSTNYADAFVAKYGSDGGLQWVRRGGGDYDDVAWSMVFNNSGTLYVTGEYNAYADFSGKAVTTTGEAEIFVTAYDQGGNVLWVKSAGSTRVDRARGIGTDGTTMFVTGQLGGAGTAGMFGSRSATSVDTSDIFIAAIDADGTWMWVTTVGGPADKFEPLGYESGISVTGHPGGNVYATGGILCNPDIPNCANTFGTISSQGFTRTDVFVTKLTWDIAAVGLKDNTFASKPMMVPNPSNGRFSVNLNGVKGELRMNVYDCTGKVLHSRSCEGGSVQPLDLTGKPEGVYFVELSNDEGHVSLHKLVIQY